MMHRSIVIYTTDTKLALAHLILSMLQALTELQGGIQLTAIDLILASFDVLANAIFKNEGQKTANLIRSYLINKVPLILASFAASAPMYPFNSELCITNALSRVDTNTFPTLTSLF